MRRPKAIAGNTRQTVCRSRLPARSGVCWGRRSNCFRCCQARPIRRSAAAPWMCCFTRGTPSLPERASVIDTGYASGLGVLMRSDTGIRSWRQLEGKTLCVTKANVEAQALAQAVGAQAQVFEAPAQALVAMRTGQCDGSVHDAALLAALRTRDDWRKFSATLEARAGSPLQLVTAPDKPALEAAFRRAVDTLDRSSSWRERAEKWAANVAFEVFFDQIGPDCH